MQYNSELKKRGVGWGEGGMSSEAFTSKVIPIFSLGLIMTGAGSYLGWGLPYGVRIAAMVITLIMVFTSRFWAHREHASMNIGIFLLFTSLMGVTLVSLLQWALQMGGPTLIVQALGTTVLTFGGLTIYGAVTKKDFSRFGGILFAAILGIIVASIVNMFVGGSTMTLIISSVSVLVFSFYIIFQMSAIRRHYSDRDYIIAAIGLYLGFINLFQDILMIMGFMRRD